MSRPPRVSVITIFLNAERFITEALDSVLRQTYKDWELLLVDDGSDDEGTNIARDYARRYPGRIRYLEHHNHRNRGMSASRNLGIREARGQYVAFLDADDVYLSDKLTRQVAILDRETEAAMVYGATQHWYSWTGEPEDQTRDTSRQLGVQPDTLIRPPSLIPLFLQRRAQTPGTCGVLVRREALDQVGAFNEEFRGMYEDQVFFFKLCLAFPVFIASGTSDRYRQHPNSHARRMRRAGAWNAKGKPSPTHRTFVTWLRDYVIEQDVMDREVWKALNAELWPYRHPTLYRVSSLVRNPSPLLGRQVFQLLRRSQ